VRVQPKLFRARPAAILLRAPGMLRIEARLQPQLRQTHLTTCFRVQFAEEPIDGSRDAAGSVLYANRALCLLRVSPPAALAALADCELALQADDGNVKARTRQHNLCRLPRMGMLVAPACFSRPAHSSPLAP